MPTLLGILYMEHTFERSRILQCAVDVHEGLFLFDAQWRTVRKHANIVTHQLVWTWARVLDKQKGVEFQKIYVDWQ